MGRARIWIGWLALVAGAVWAGAPPLLAQDSTPQSRAAQRVPLEKVPDPVRERVRQVLAHPTMFSHGPAEAFSGRPALYDWLLDHPDRALIAWRRLGAKCTSITDQSEGCFTWTDGHGSEVHWRTIYNNPSLRIWYAEGRIHPGLLLPAVPVQFVLLLRHGARPETPDRTLIYHQADVFVQTDNETAALVARLLGPSADRLAEQYLGQVELFFSGLVWYLNQHPDRAQKLLAEGLRP